MAYGEGWLPIKHSLPDGSSPLMPAVGRRLTLQDEYLVGAVDCVRYTDAFFHNEFSSQYFGPDMRDTGRRGALDFCWPRDGRKYLAPDAAGAAEANLQSERDFGELMLTSGIVQLSSAAARLRFLSTPPLESQTVTGVTAHARQFLSEDATEASSPWMFGAGVIKRDAVLKKFDARAKATVQTQVRGYPFAFNYRVRLVSVDHSVGSTGIWAARNYHGEIWKGDYLAASGDPRDKRLDVSINRNGVLADHLIHEGPSPTEPKTFGNRLTFKASTFDWYVPALGAVTALDPDLTEASIKALKFKTGSLEGVPGNGGRSIHLERPSPMKLLKDEGDPFASLRTSPTFEGLLNNDLDLAFGDTSAAERYLLEQAERRWVSDEEVTFQWQMVWNGQNLVLTVDGSPTDRPYQLLLVIEEDVYSGETLPQNVQHPTDLDALRTELHTVFPLEVVNQVVVVPEDFFRGEKEALERGAQLWQDCNSRFAISAGIQRRPPRGDLHRRLSEIVGESESTASLAEKHNRQLAHVMATSPEVLEDVIQARDLPSVDLERLAHYR